MSYGEREALSGLITSLIVIGLFLWQLGAQEAAGAFEGPEALQAWARSAGLARLAALGVDADLHEEVAKAALVASSMKGNPVALTETDLRRVLETA